MLQPKLDPTQYSGALDSLRGLCEVATLLMVVFYMCEEINQNVNNYNMGHYRNFIKTSYLTPISQLMTPHLKERKIHHSFREGEKSWKWFDLLQRGALLLLRVDDPV